GDADGVDVLEQPPCRVGAGEAEERAEAVAGFLAIALGPAAGAAGGGAQGDLDEAEVAAEQAPPPRLLEEGAVGFVEEQDEAGPDARRRHFFGRSFKRKTRRRADQVSSTAQTLLSTRPLARAMSRTMFSLRSVSTPEAFLGQQIQRAPSGSKADFRRANFFSS